MSRFTLPLPRLEASLRNSEYTVIVLAALLSSISAIASADDEYVRQAMSLTARDFDSDLPGQPISDWLRDHISSQYQVVWGEHVTDCGEGTGTSADEGRDMPICVEVALNEGPEMRGCLNLSIGTRDRGFLKGGYKLYFGYIEQGGKKYNFKRLSDVLRVK
jgi:hypothetical protein